MPIGDLLGTATDRIEDITGQPSGSEGGSLDTFEEDDFTIFNEGELQVNQWDTLAEYHVEPQTEYNIGYGKASLPENQGSFYAHFEDGSGNVVTGQVRVKTDNANETNPDTEISGVSTSRLDTTEGDASKQHYLEEKKDTPKVGENSKIILQFRRKDSSSGTSISQSASRILLDATRYD